MASWFHFVNNFVKISHEASRKHNILIEKCILCDSGIISKAYQQKECGSRYCSQCYDKLENKFYCKACLAENLDNFVHRKDQLFVDKALSKDLEKIDMKCPDCEIKMKIIKLEEHVRVCEKGWEFCTCTEMKKKGSSHVCPNVDSVSKRKSSTFEICSFCGKESENMEAHKSQCKFSPNRNCPFECSENGPDHRKHRQLFHLDKAWAVICENKLNVCKNENSQKYTDLIRTVANEIKVNLGIEKEKVENLKKEIDSLNKVIADENGKYNGIKTNLKKDISESLHTSFDGTILWKIENFTTVKSQGSIFSPPFYTSRFGYKLCLRLYPTGDSTVTNLAMSLFLVIMKGKYDGLLGWPFKQKVTFLLLDQDFKQNHEESFMPSDSSNFLRPQMDMNVPEGISQFIRLDEFRSRGYLRDDTVFIRCIVDTSDLHE